MLGKSQIKAFNSRKNASSDYQTKRDEGRSLSESTCPSCGGFYFSDYWKRGHCSDCGETLCFRCWAMNRHSCKETLQRNDEFTVCRNNGIDAKLLSGEAPKTSEPALVSINQSHSLPRTQQFQIPRDTIAWTEAAHRQAMFTHFITDAAHRLKYHPADSRFKLQKVKISSMEGKGCPSNFISKPFTQFTSRWQRMRELPVTSAFSLYPVYKRKSKAFHYASIRIQLDCIANVNRAEFIDKGYAYAADQKILAQRLSTKPQPRNNGITIMFSPSGWDENLTLPLNVALVSWNNSGHWQCRHNISDLRHATYVEAVFDADALMDKIIAYVKNVLKQGEFKLPLSAHEVAGNVDAPIDLVIEAFHRTTKNDRGMIVCKDRQKNDWLLDAR